MNSRLRNKKLIKMRSLAILKENQIRPTTKTDSEDLKLWMVTMGKIKSVVI
jgi:hypothetical protein